MGKKDSPPLPPYRQAVHLNCFCSRNDQSIIGIAINPGLAWIEGLNDRMTGLTLVTAGMLIGGVITAANVATGQADAQVDPFGAHLHTFFTAGRAGIDIVDLSKVRADGRIDLTRLHGSINPIAGMYVFYGIGNQNFLLVLKLDLL
jgi:hypothetical protein